MSMQLDGITLTAYDHGAGRAAVERPPLPVDPARAGRPVLWPLLIGAKRKEQP
jgi:hypothetical protein